MKNKLLFYIVAFLLLFAAVSCSGLPEESGETSSVTDSESVTVTDGKDSDTVSESFEDTEAEAIIETDSTTAEYESTETDSDAETETESETETETECRHGRTRRVTVTAASCTELGVLNVICRDCNEIIDTQDIPLEDHKKGVWVIEIEPTAEDDGLKTTTCTECGEKLQEVLAAVGYSEGLEFRSNNDGTCAVVSKGSCRDAHISIPRKSPDGDKVTSIAPEAFYDDQYIRSVRLPISVENIGAKAFSNAYKLEKVYFSQRLKTIGDNAFYGCALVSVELSEGVVSIGKYAFHDCVKLESITLPEGLLEIGWGAFGYCSSLSEICIPSSVEKIGQEFITSGDIKKITVAEENNRYNVVNNCLIEDGKVLIVGYGNCSIPDGIVEIGNSAFYNHTELTKINFPSSVEHIGAYAFAGTAIKEIVIPSKVYSIATGAFIACENLEKVSLTNSVGFIGGYIFEWCDKLREIKFYGSEEDWNAIDLDPDNEVLFKVGVTFVDDFPPDSIRGYGRTTISGNVAYAYDMLASHIMADEPLSKITFDSKKGLTPEEFNIATHIFLSDYPECFWWRGAGGYAHNGSVIFSFTPTYLYTGDELKEKKGELNAAVDAIIAELPGGSNYDKALYLHDKLASLVHYEITDDDQTPYGALVEGLAVCNGYATAYQLLLMEAGIRAWTVNGMAGGVAHAWNVVWMDRETCVYTDVTWDDQDEKSGEIMRYYFNMSLDEIDDNHTANSFFVLPECGHTNESYTDVSDDYNLLKTEDGVEVIAEFFVDDGSFLRAHFFFDGERAEAGRWLEEKSEELYSLLNARGLTYYITGNEVVVTLVKENENE